MGMPIGVQRISFTVISILMAKLIASYGSTGIGVQKIGLQVESLSFMTIAGLYGAMSAFIGQNHGAKNSERIKDGYKYALAFSFSIGLITMVCFIAFARSIFGIFVEDPATINMGVNYLRIIGLSQVFMCIEIVTMGSFNGLGKTYIPATISLVFTTLRIPLAFYLAGFAGLGLDGVWWSISLTSMVKGLLLVSLFIVALSRLKTVYSTR